MPGPEIIIAGDEMTSRLRVAFLYEETRESPVPVNISHAAAETYLIRRIHVPLVPGVMRQPISFSLFKKAIDLIAVALETAIHMLSSIRDPIGYMVLDRGFSADIY